MLAFYFGDWTTWAPYDPVNGYIGPQKVTFDGTNKLILINYGETEIDFKVDIYSAWKEWARTSQTAGFEQALRVVGGDPTVGGNALGATFFLVNGWKIRTWEGSHNLTVNGNFFSEDGSDPFVNTLDNWIIKIQYTVSNLIDQIAASDLTEDQISSVGDAVWDYDMTDVDPETQLAKGLLRYFRDKGFTVTDFLALSD